ncbi:acyl-CoA thioesterase domain-containing protein [Auraticoccus monumenti]|uniref:Thioesterase-like superfamily protein n=1 Tax=Auraticoccus monumenti TaxID=675864 RepID=A0A1G7CHL6_9ACTN|nr:acyl-CoA thioesterase domain-containing protein [Auraticoccus monumenti]SDE38884.1 Thioesterase-like superfamily protein [Auraticoccus monumenti]
MSSLPDPAGLEADAPAYYRRSGPDRFVPTLHAQGAWQPGEQHLAAVSGLVAAEVARHRPRPELQPTRLGYEVYGVIPAAETTVTVRTLRPGRTIELVEAVVEVGGRVVVRAAVWRVLVTDTSEVAGGAPEPLPPPSSLPLVDATRQWPGGFIASLEIRGAEDAVPGRSRVWLRARPDLVADEEVDDTTALMGLVDTANGVAVRADPRRWMFPNTDLAVHLHRRPTGRWLGLDTTQVIGPAGAGTTGSTLHDVDGGFGSAAQALTVRRLPPPPDG